MKLYTHVLKPYVCTCIVIYIIFVRSPISSSEEFHVVHCLLTAYLRLSFYNCNLQKRINNIISTLNLKYFWHWQNVLSCTLKYIFNFNIFLNIIYNNTQSHIPTLTCPHIIENSSPIINCLQLHLFRWCHHCHQKYMVC